MVKLSKRAIVCMLLSMVLFSGCGENKREEEVPYYSAANESGQANESTENADAGNGEKPLVKGSKNMESDFADSTTEYDANGGEMTPPKTQEVPIYTIDEDTLETKATVVTIPDDYEITATLVVQLVVDDFAEKSYEVSVEDVFMEDNNVVVSFKGDTPPVTGVKSMVENTILDGIAQSLIDNVSEVEGVIFRVLNQPYKSANHSFSLDEVYLSK